MADVEKAFSDLDTAGQLDNTDIFALSKVSGNSWISAKATLTALATKIATAFNFTSALQTTNKTLTGAINEIAQGGGGGSTDVIADDFSTESTYAVGDYVIYDGSLYKCTTAVTTAGAWDSNDWTETLVMDEVEAGGGGGTTVIANPSGTATDDLTKVQIGSTIYDIPGGGSGGGGIVIDKLWEYSNSYDITLSHDFTDYDFLVFEGNNWRDANHKGGSIVSSAELESIRGVTGKMYTFVGASGEYVNYTVASKTSMTVVEGSSRVTTVWGIKSAGGGSSWTDVTGTLTAGSTSITLSDAAITTSSTIEVFNDLDVPYNSKTLSTGSITLTFDAQQSDMSVKVRVS